MRLRNTSPFQYGLGDKVKDSVTGYSGTITGRTEYLNGCIRYIVEAMRGDDIKEFCFDEDRLTVVESGKREVPLLRTGGPHTAPSRTGATPNRTT